MGCKISVFIDSRYLINRRVNLNEVFKAPATKRHSRGKAKIKIARKPIIYNSTHSEPWQNLINLGGKTLFITIISKRFILKFLRLGGKHRIFGHIIIVGNPIVHCIQPQVEAKMEWPVIKIGKVINSFLLTIGVKRSCRKYKRNYKVF